MKVGDRVILVPVGTFWDEPREPRRRIWDGREGVIVELGQWDIPAGDFSYFVAVRWDGEDTQLSYFKGTLQLALLEVEAE